MMNNNCSYLECGNSENAERIPVKLTFSRKELLYDIQNYAYIEGHVMGDENLYAKHTLMDIGEEGNVDRVTRILNVVHAAAVEMLYPYTQEEAVEEEVSDRLEVPEEYVIALEVPKETYSRTTVRLLSRLIHEYMVYKVLADWLSITNPKSAENWLAKSEEAEKQINSIKHQRRSAFTRRIDRPF